MYKPNQKFSLLAILTYLGLLFSIAFLYFSVIDRMYIYTMLFLLLAILNLAYNAFFTAWNVLKINKRILLISSVGTILGFIPFISLIISYYRITNAISG